MGAERKPGGNEASVKMREDCSARAPFPQRFLSLQSSARPGTWKAWLGHPTPWLLEGIVGLPFVLLVTCTLASCVSSLFSGVSTKSRMDWCNIITGGLGWVDVYQAIREMWAKGSAHLNINTNNHISILGLSGTEENRSTLNSIWNFLSFGISH